MIRFRSAENLTAFRKRDAQFRGGLADGVLRRRRPRLYPARRGQGEFERREI